MDYVYVLHDECHGNTGCYANIERAKEDCIKNAKNYDIDPSTELDYDGSWFWGWGESYIERVEVIQ